MSDVAPELVVVATASVIKGCCGLPDTACSCTADSSTEEYA
jgi:hypothetical protein